MHYFDKLFCDIESLIPSLKKETISGIKDAVEYCVINDLPSKTFLKKKYLTDFLAPTLYDKVFVCIDNIKKMFINLVDKVHKLKITEQGFGYDLIQEDVFRIVHLINQWRCLTDEYLELFGKSFDDFLIYISNNRDKIDLERFNQRAKMDFIIHQFGFNPKDREAIADIAEYLDTLDTKENIKPNGGKSNAKRKARKNQKSG